MKYFKLPDLGEGLQEAEIVEWSVRAGDQVDVDQLLLTVETAKALVDIPSPQAGIVAHLFCAPGDTVHVGEALLEFAGDESDAPATVVGRLASVSVTSTEPEPERFTVGFGRSGAATTVAATPAVRALAVRLGVELESISGTGPGGVITGSDVELAASRDRRHGSAQPLRGLRLAMARNMERAGSEVVQATVFDDVDINRWPSAAEVTLRVVLAIAAACRIEPALNAWFDGRSRRLRLHRKVDLGVAVDAADGLLVPVMRDIGERSEEEIATGLSRLKADARARALPPEELRNPTITLSNFGSLGGRYAAPVVMPPTVAIVAAGEVFDAVVPCDGVAVIRRLLPLSLSFDHRCVTGAEAIGFLQAMKEALTSG